MIKILHDTNMCMFDTDCINSLAPGVFDCSLK